MFRLVSTGWAAFLFTTMSTTLLPPTPTGTEPPSANKEPHVTDIHGERLVDDYFWLREKTRPDVAQYLEAENAYTDAFMKPLEGLQDTLYREMLARIKETDANVPYRLGEYFYYSRTEQGKQYPIYCRKKGSLDAPEEITIDLNVLAVGEKFMSLGSYVPNDAGTLLAYATDVTGFRQYTLVVKDLVTGQHLDVRVEKTGSVAWSTDNRTLFYTIEDAAKRQYRLYRHRLGTQAHDLIYEETDEAFSVYVSRTRSREYLLLNIGSLTTSEVRYVPSSRPDDEWKLVAPRVQDHEYELDHHGDLFYVRANDKGRNFRVVTAPVGQPGREHWTELVPHRADVMVEGLECFKSYYVLQEREGGLPQLRVTDLGTHDTHRIAFPEPTYTVYPSSNFEFDTRQLRYNYQSLVTPPSVFDYDMSQRTTTLLKEQPVLGGYDRAQYASEWIKVTAKDGVQVPVSIVYKKGVKQDGSTPLLLTGYGSYGISLPISFSSNRLSLLDRGFIYAIAHIRGGGDLGKPWHDAGRMMNKKNTFTDFIAAAEHLIAEKYTSSQRLVIEGGSAGGLLMGAVSNMRPDLFKAVILQVPFLDVINTMLDESLPLTVGEFEEWGNPKKKPEFDYIRSYSPYDSLEKKTYPAMLVKTSFNDSQVMYWEPAKYVAKLRTLKTDSEPLLLKTNMAAGHGGASGRYDALRELAFSYAFLLNQVGM